MCMDALKMVKKYGQEEEEVKREKKKLSIFSC